MLELSENAKRGNHLTKSQYVHATTNTSITATFITTTTNPATTSIATTRKGNMLILVMLLALPLLLLVTLDTTTSNSKYLNTTSMTSITITPKGMKGIFSSFFLGGG
jgi:hypothetical protein